MTVGELQKLLSEYNPDEEIFVWRGNGHEPYFNYTSNIKISRPYGNSHTNKGLTSYPLILSAHYEQDKKDEKILSKQWK